MKAIVFLKSFWFILSCKGTVKNGRTIDSSGRVEYSLSSKNKFSEQNGSSNKTNRRRGGGDVEGSGIQDIDLGSVMNSSNQGSSDHDDSGDGISGTSSSSMSNCLSGNVSEEEDDDGCLDDWEAIADAVNAYDENQPNIIMVSETPKVHDTSNASAANSPRADLSITECISAVPESRRKGRAWKHDDALRPRCLPNLSKQHNSLLKSDWHGNRKAIPWSWQSVISQPSECPICCEDLDVTDSNFLPCSCGFHLCLFCHKRILEADGRCPGCRKLYDHVDCSIVFNI